MRIDKETEDVFFDIIESIYREKAKYTSPEYIDTLILEVEIMYPELDCPLCKRIVSILEKLRDEKIQERIKKGEEE
jgi:phage FluMu protein Com